MCLTEKLNLSKDLKKQQQVHVAVWKKCSSTMELEVARAEARASQSPSKVCGWDSDYLEQGSVEERSKKVWDRATTA